MIAAAQILMAAVAATIALRVILTDMRRLIVENWACLGLFLLGLLQALAFPIAPYGVVDHLLGAGYASAILMVVLLVANRGERTGFGFGDVKLGFALGAWTAWQGVAVFLLLSSLWGLLVAGYIWIGRLRRGRKRARPRLFPFGPGMVLAAATVVALNALGWTVGPQGPDFSAPATLHGPSSASCLWTGPAGVFAWPSPSGQSPA